LASIVSVMFGVWILIVVNSVMEGFSCEMQNRIHGILSDVVVEHRNFSGMPDAEGQMESIRKAVGDDIEAMTPVVAVPALIVFQYGGQSITRQTQLIGIDEKTQSLVSDFSKYLQHPENRKEMSFNLRNDGYDVRDHQAGADAPERPQMAEAGWNYRKRVAENIKFQDEYNHSSRNGSDIRQQSYEEARYPGSGAGHSPEESDTGPVIPPPSTNGPTSDPISEHPSAITAEATAPFDMAKQQNTGVVLGISMSCIRMLKDKSKPNGACEDRFLTLPGDDIQITCPTVGLPPKEVSGTFTIVDFYESKMSEYDSNFAFVPIHELQKMRGMIDQETGTSKINSIYIKLKPGVKGEVVRDKLAAVFSPDMFVVETWRDKQGPLLAAVQMETAILNVLLFLIIVVAGFGILATFYMIVVEKTKDIGILKSLGAASQGVMGIFLAYGLLLGLVGSGGGLVIGLITVRYINQIADFLGWLRGQPVFDPTVYYFYKIPTIIEPPTVIGIVLGAVMIAVIASILPACRAARLHPVEALRYE
jgi:lipoprotein-releasing system permease protein